MRDAANGVDLHTLVARTEAEVARTLLLESCRLEATEPADGIAVEGLDESTWALAPDQPSTLQAVASPERPGESPPAPSGTFTVHRDGPVKEYKLLTSRDKIFEGKFDMARLEEAINHLAKQGWVARSMCLPHMKNFQGAMQEEVVVLMER